MTSSTLRCPECGTPREDPPDATALPYGTVVYLTCAWCGERYGARVLHRRDPSDDVPPGMLAVAQLAGGGTQVVAGPPPLPQPATAHFAAALSQPQSVGLSRDPAHVSRLSDVDVEGAVESAVNSLAGDALDRIQSEVPDLRRGGRRE